MSTYTYNKECDVLRLESEVKASAITIVLDNITATDTSVDLTFKAALSTVEAELLTAIVNAHVNEPLPKDNTITVIPVAFPDPDGKRARLYGTHFMTCAANDVTEQSYTFSADRIMDGAEYICKGGQLGDYVDFEVVHPSLGVLDDFCTRWYVAEGRALYKLYPAFVPAGLSVRVRYTNIGAAEASIALNMFLHQP